MSTTFGALYQNHARDVYRFLLHLSGNPVVAQDLTSETFVRCLTNYDRIRAESVRAYLLAIARNLYLKEARRLSRQEEIAESMPDPRVDIEATTSQRHRLDGVLQALKALPEVDRSALLMRVDQEMSYDEIARVLGLSLSAVKVKIHRSRLKLAAFRS